MGGGNSSIPVKMKPLPPVQGNSGEVDFFVKLVHRGGLRGYKGMPDREFEKLDSDLGGALRNTLSRYSAGEVEFLSGEIIPLLAALKGSKEIDRFLRSFIMASDNLGKDIAGIASVLGHVVTHCHDTEKWPMETNRAVWVIKAGRLRQE